MTKPASPAYLPVDAYAQRNGMTLSEVFQAAIDGRLPLGLRMHGKLFYAWKQPTDGRPAVMALCSIKGILTPCGLKCYEDWLLGTTPELHTIAALTILPEFPPAITIINDDAYGEPHLSLEGLLEPRFRDDMPVLDWQSGEPGIPIDDALSEIEQGVNSFLPAKPLRVERGRFVVPCDEDNLDQHRQQQALRPRKPLQDSDPATVIDSAITALEEQNQNKRTPGFPEVWAYLLAKKDTTGIVAAVEGRELVLYSNQRMTRETARQAYNRRFR